jgi:hypothetical protein
MTIKPIQLEHLVMNELSAITAKIRPASEGQTLKRKRRRKRVLYDRHLNDIRRRRNRRKRRRRRR